jgi:hypothetical protein
MDRHRLTAVDEEGMRDEFNTALAIDRLMVFTLHLQYAMPEGNC